MKKTEPIAYILHVFDVEALSSGVAGVDNDKSAGLYSSGNGLGVGVLQFLELECKKEHDQKKRLV